MSLNPHRSLSVGAHSVLPDLFPYIFPSRRHWFWFSPWYPPFRLQVVGRQDSLAWNMERDSRLFGVPRYEQFCPSSVKQSGSSLGRPSSVGLGGFSPEFLRIGQGWVLSLHWGSGSQDHEPTKINKNKLYTSSYPGEFQNLKRKKEKEKQSENPKKNPGVKTRNHKNRWPEKDRERELDFHNLKSPRNVEQCLPLLGKRLRSMNLGQNILKYEGGDRHFQIC